jgi:hypothetical protein
MSNIDHYTYECPHLNWAPKDYVPLCGGQRWYYIMVMSDDFSKIMQQRLYSARDKLISQKSPFHEILHPISEVSGGYNVPNLKFFNVPK